jgi:hypothetical protein
MSDRDKAIQEVMKYPDDSFKETAIHFAERAISAERILREVRTSEEEPKTPAWYWHDEIDKHFAGVK